MGACAGKRHAGAGRADSVRRARRRPLVEALGWVTALNRMLAASGGLAVLSESVPWCYDRPLWDTPCIQSGG